MELDELKKAVYNRINALLTQSVYTKQAPEGAVYPYAVITFPSSSSPLLWKQDWIIEIDYWDDTNDSSTVTAMSHTVKTGFQGYWYSSTDVAFRTYLDFEGEFPTDLPELSRINQRYSCPAK